MRNPADRFAMMQLFVFVAVVAAAIVGFHLFFLRPAHGAIIDPHLTSPAYVTVIAEKGDTAYSIAKLFTPRGQSPMPLATAFVAFNNLRYNKKGNPVVQARHLYAVPTKLSRDMMRATIGSLNTSARDWHREHRASNHPYIMGLKKAVAQAEQAAARTRSEDLGDTFVAWALGMLGVAVMLLCVGVAVADYRKHVAKLDAVPPPEEPPPALDGSETSASPAASAKEVVGTSNGEQDAPAKRSDDGERAGKFDVVRSTSERQEGDGTQTQRSQDSVPEKEGTVDGTKESKALPPAYRDPKEPYMNLTSPTGLSLAQMWVNLARTRPIEEVAAALQEVVIPMLGGKGIRLRNLPESLPKHPEWASRTFNDIQTTAAATVRNNGKVPVTDLPMGTPTDETAAEMPA